VVGGGQNRLNWGEWGERARFYVSAKTKIQSKAELKSGRGKAQARLEKDSFVIITLRSKPGPLLSLGGVQGGRLS